MLIYGGVISLTTALAWKYQKSEEISKKYIFGLMVLLVGIFAGLRGVGTDYLLYQDRFELLAEGKFEITSFSLVYTFMKLFIALGINYQVLILLISLITNFLIFYVICMYEKYISVPYAVLAYMLMFYQMSFNIFRQLLAMSIFLIALYNLIEKNSKRTFWCLFILAVLVHSISIVFGVIYFILPIIEENKYFKLRVMGYFLSILCVFLLPKLAQMMNFIAEIVPHYAYYLKNLQFQGIGIGIIRYVLLVFLPIMYLKYYKQEFNNDLPVKLQYCVFLSLTGAILWLTSYTSMSDMYRIAYYGLVTLPILFGFMIKNMKKNRKNITLSVLMTILLLFFWWYDFIFTNSCATYPYKFFLNL